MAVMWSGKDVDSKPTIGVAAWVMLTSSGQCDWTLWENHYRIFKGDKKKYNLFKRLFSQLLENGLRVKIDLQVGKLRVCLLSTSRKELIVFSTWVLTMEGWCQIYKILWFTGCWLHWASNSASGGRVGDTFPQRTCFCFFMCSWDAAGAKAKPVVFTNVHFAQHSTLLVTENELTYPKVEISLWRLTRLLWVRHSISPGAQEPANSGLTPGICLVAVSGRQRPELRATARTLPSFVRGSDQ